MHVDLGSGFKPRGDRNFDIRPFPMVEICHLGFEKIPVEDNTADLVIAFDLLEHIPKVYHWEDEDGWHIRYPLLFLIEEVWRILKEGKLFDVHSPVVGQDTMFAPYCHATQLTPFSFNIFDERKQHIKEIQQRRELDNIKAVFRILNQGVEIEDARYFWKLQKIIM